MSTEQKLIVTHQPIPGRLARVLLFLLAWALVVTASVSARHRSLSPAFDEIDTFVQSEMTRAGIPGLALAIVAGDDVVYLQGYGSADTAGTPVSPQTPFIIGSVSKTFTALAIHQLAEQGLVDLQAPVQRYVPTFTLADRDAAAQITPQHLLDHTSGLPKAAGEQAYQLDPRYTTTDLVHKAAGVTPDRPVGASREYSNLNYLLLGLVVEAASGQTYTDYVRTHIWQPLDMTHSYFSEEEAEGLATGYRTYFGLRVPATAPFPPGMLPCGYIISSAEDLSHYLVAYLNGGRYDQAAVLASTDSYDVYWNPLPGGGRNVESSHSGGTLNYNADIHLLPGERVGVAVLTNTRHLWDDLLPVTTAASIASSVARQVAGWPVPAPPALALWQSYALLDLLAFGIAFFAFARLWRSLRPRHTGNHQWRPLALLILDLLLSALLFAGIPALSRQHWDYLLSSQPDLAGLAVVAAVFLALAGLVSAARLLMRRQGETARLAASATP